MSNPFIGEIRMFGGSFAPAGWAFCDGSLLPISENDALFTLIGTTYGGDGQQTFGLPDLRGRIPIHAGQGSGLSNRVLAESGGSEAVTLTVNQIPGHTHPVVGASVNGPEANPGNNFLAGSTAIQPYAALPPTANMAANSIPGAVGGSQPHTNVQPFLCISFIISLFGVFPSQT